MAHPIIMPKAGQSMTEGKVISWLKKEGEAVRAGDPVLEIETDKANMEVEAEHDGILKAIVAQEGETCPVLTLIGVIGTADEEIDIEALKKSIPEADAAGPAGGDDPLATELETPTAPPRGAPAASTPAAPPQPAAAAPRPALAAVSAAPPAFRLGTAPARPQGRVFASPLARRLARDRGVDLHGVRGTGPGGRILRRDVDTAPVGPAPGTSSASWGVGNGALLVSAASKPYPPPSERPAARVPMEGMRKAIASALQQSKQTIPHFYATMVIDMSAALGLKQSLEATGTKVSVNDLVVRACVIALVDEPRVNCRVAPDHVDYPADVNLGIAVGQEYGLVVPVVTKAQSRDLAELSSEVKRVVKAAQSGKLIGSGQGTFTVSNLGMFGVESFSAIVNPPEGAILAVGAVTTEIAPVFGGFLPRSVMRVTLSCDHRAVDGLLAARFLQRVKHLLESPDRL